MIREFAEMLVPKLSRRVPQRVKRIEHRELHVGMDAMDQCHPPVTEVEDHGILVRDARRAEKHAGLAVELEAAVRVDKPMGTNAPRQPGLGKRQAGIRHHPVVLASAGDQLDSRIFEAGHRVGRAVGEYPQKRVLDAVARSEQQHVGHVVKKPWARFGVASIPRSNPPCEEVIAAVVEDDAGVEDRFVSIDRTRAHDRARSQPPWSVCVHRPLRVSAGPTESEAFDVHEPREVFQRHPGNPILTASQWPDMVNAVFNPAAIMFEGETLLLVRVEDRTGLSRLTVARSRDGYSNWIIETERSLLPELAGHEERWGIEDARITKCGDDYMIVYTGFSEGGPLVCLASTRDFRTFTRHGVIMSPEDKDAALYPCQFGGRWVLIHRPVPTMAGLGAHVWVSWSPDLIHWGDPSILIPARRGGWWDANKVGLGPPPLRTAEGWLLCYHGVKVTASGSVYRLGLALADLEHPEQLIARSNEWVFGPSAPYERSGDVSDVVFPCGWILDDDGDTVRMYYGAADTSVCVATASLSDLLGLLDRHPADAVLSLPRASTSTSPEVLP